MVDDEASLENKQMNEDETDIFLGANPTSADSSEIEISDSIAARLKVWISKGLTEKEEKENLIKLIPRKGKVMLEAPTLNDEMSVDLHPKALARDEYFKEYQNLTGSALSSTSVVLDMILNDLEEPIDRDLILTNLSSSVKLLSHLFYSLTQARKTFLLGKYEERIQKILKKIEPTSYLFGDNLKGVIESSKAMEKVSKDLKPKPKAPLKPNNSLNWKSSSVKKEGSRMSFKSHSSRGNTSRTFRQRPYPAKKHYQQAQPQQNRR